MAGKPGGAGFPAGQRLAAAEKAATYGAVAPERLADAYLAAELTDEDRQNPLNRAKAAARMQRSRRRSSTTRRPA